MKYAIISDIHANPVALGTVLADIRKQKAEKIVFLGDVTGYGYDAATALRKIRMCADVCLMGNHDAACAKLYREELVRQVSNYDLDRAQRDEVAAEGMKWLASRPLTWTPRNRGFACVHGEFAKPRLFAYVLNAEDAARSFQARKEPLLFVGHSHHAECYALTPKGEVKAFPWKSFKPRKGWRYLVNVGSVGYPRNDYVTTYAIYDDEAKSVKARTLPFDFRSYVENLIERKIRLPGWLLRLLADVRKE